MLWKDWLGKTGEAKAMHFLKKKGYFIRRRNFRTRLGEIDLIAQHNDCVIFVEVKTIVKQLYFKPEDRFDYKKRRKQIMMGNLYMAGLKGKYNARFDLITVIKKDGDFFIEHYENVIDEASL
jgi:putative endonuclease